MPRLGDRTLDQRGVHERHRGGVCEDECDESGHAVAAIGASAAGLTVYLPRVGSAQSMTVTATNPE